MAPATTLQSRPPAPVAVGLMEALGQVSDTDLLVGGWSNEQPEQGGAILVICSDRAVEARWHALWSDRPDVGPNTGFSGLLELDAAVEASAVTAIQISATAAIGLYEQRVLLDQRQAAARLRPLRTALQHPSADLAVGYDGSDTIATSHLPIRLGIDDCVRLAGGTIMLSGWLFDPENLVGRVELSAGPLTRVISANWITRSRPDVIASISGEPRFAPYAGSADHCGFTALLHSLPDDTDAHLTLVTSSDTLHAPLTPRQGNAPLLLTAMLSGLAPDLPSSMQIAETLVAPALARLEPQRPRIVRCDEIGFDQAAPLAMVIGCHGDVSEVLTLLASLSAEPLARSTPIFVAGPAMELAASERAIGQHAAFFGLRLTLVRGEGVGDHVDALALGALASGAERVCLLAADIVPTRDDWLAGLAAIHPLHPSVIVPSQFDHTTFGPRPSQRERARILASADCCLAPRTSVVEAYQSLPVMLDRTGKSRALLAALERDLQRLDAADIDLLNGAIADPAGPLLRRADQAAWALRATGSLR